MPNLAETPLPLPALAQSDFLYPAMMTAFSSRYLMALWLLIGFAAPVWATPTLEQEQEQEQEQEIRTSFVTPHTPWAKPYAGGMTRVLFFSNYRNTQAREIVELMQRFEVQADAAYWTRGFEKPRRYQWHGGEEGVARIRRLLDSGAHDVFLFNGVSLDGLSAAVKQDLRARVAPVALNDPTGRWVVRLKELYSSRLMEIPLVVRQEVNR